MMTVSDLQLQLQKARVENTKLQIACQVNGGQSGTKQVAVLSQIAVNSSKYNRITEKSSASESQSSKPDEMGLRAFIRTLLEGKQSFTFSQEEIIDQIETFIQLKMAKYNAMVQKYQERLAKAQKETKTALLECKKVTAQKSNVQAVFEDCLKQVLDDKKNGEQISGRHEPRVKMNFEPKEKRKFVTLKPKKTQKRNSVMMLEGTNLNGQPR